MLRNHLTPKGTKETKKMDSSGADPGKQPLSSHHDNEMMIDGSDQSSLGLDTQGGENGLISDANAEVLNCGESNCDVSTEPEISSEQASSSQRNQCNVVNDVQSVTNETTECQYHVKEEIVDEDEGCDIFESGLETENVGLSQTRYENEVLDDLNEDTDSVKVENATGTSSRSTITSSCIVVTQKPSRIVYRCKYCGQQLQKISSLQKHEDAHRNGTIYKCRYCEYYSLQRDRIEAHERKHTGEKPYSCDKCEFRCSCMGDLKKHDRIHFPTRRYKCPLCPYQSKWTGGITRHMRAHSDNRPFCCDICNESFKTKYVLENHMKRHSSEKNFFCDECDYTCRTRNLLSLHRKAHSDIRNFACSHPGCSQRCKTRSDLVKHMSVHRTTYDFQCLLCDKKFKSKQSLRFHIRRHEVREYPCKICEKVLCSKNSLRLHLSLHTGKKHECPVCAHRFATMHNLKVHLKVHDDSRTFRCPLCVYGFETANHLFTHIGAVHGKDYVYFCEICLRPFSRYLMIKSHIDRYHREDGITTPEFVYDSQCMSSQGDNMDKKCTPLLKECEMERRDGEEMISDFVRPCEDRKPDLAECLIKSINNNIPVDKNYVPLSLSSNSHFSQSNEDSLCNGDDANELVTKTASECADHSSNTLAQTNVVDISNNSASSRDLHDFETVSSASPENVAVANCNSEDRTFFDLGNRELTIKLERLPENFELCKEEFQSVSTEKSNIIDDKSQTSRIIRLGTYASIGINLAGKDSGIKFTLKRGKKSSKWFLNPNNLTEDAAEKTRLFLTKQSSYVKQKERCKRKRKKPKSKTNTSQELQSGSISKDKPPRKKKRLSAKNKCSLLTFPEDITVKTEVELNHYQIPIQIHSSCKQQRSKGGTRKIEGLSESYVSLESLDRHTNISTDVEKSFEKGRGKKTTTLGKKGQITSKSSKTSLKGVKSKTYAFGPTIEKNESFELRESETSQFLEPPENLLEQLGDTHVQSTSTSLSAVLGVEKFVDSPLQITWKKVGGIDRGRKKQAHQNSSFSLLTEAKPGMHLDSLSVGESNEYLPKGISEILSSSKDENHAHLGTVVTDSSFPEENDGRDVLGHSHNGYSNNQEANLKWETAESSSNRHSINRGVKVLSLKEFEEEYRKKPKIIANVSLNSEIKIIGNKGRKPNSGKGNKGRKRLGTNIHVMEKSCVKKASSSHITDNIDYHCQNPDYGLCSQQGLPSQAINDLSHPSWQREAVIKVSLKEFEEEYRRKSETGANLPEKQNLVQNASIKKRKVVKKRAVPSVKTVTKGGGLESMSDNIEMRNTSDGNLISSSTFNRNCMNYETFEPSVNYKNVVSNGYVRNNIVNNCVGNPIHKHQSVKKARCEEMMKDFTSPVSNEITLVSQEVEAGSTKITLKKKRKDISGVSKSTPKKKLKSKSTGKLKVSALFGTSMDKGILSHQNTDKKSKATVKKEQYEINRFDKNTVSPKSTVTKQPPKKRIKKNSEVEESKVHPNTFKLKRVKKVCKPNGANVRKKASTGNSSQSVLSKIKLPGLMSGNLIEKRLTVECVASLPKVKLRNISAVSTLDRYNPHLCIPNENNGQIIIDVHPPFDPTAIERCGRDEESCVKIESEADYYSCGQPELWHFQSLNSLHVPDSENTDHSELEHYYTDVKRESLSNVDSSVPFETDISISMNGDGLCPKIQCSPEVILSCEDKLLHQSQLNVDISSNVPLETDPPISGNRDGPCAEMEPNPEILPCKENVLHQSQLNVDSSSNVPLETDPPISGNRDGPCAEMEPNPEILPCKENVLNESQSNIDSSSNVPLETDPPICINGDGTCTEIQSNPEILPCEEKALKESQSNVDSSSSVPVETDTPTSENSIESGDHTL